MEDTLLMSQSVSVISVYCGWLVKKNCGKLKLSRAV